MTLAKVDVAIIGGGMYGGFTAYEIAKRYPDYRVVVLEALPQLFGRASQTNQGQLHEGYVYSGDPELAIDCAHHGRLFREAFPGVEDTHVSTYYGIHRDSLVTPHEYETFCRSVGLSLRPIHSTFAGLFGHDVVAVYKTTEKAFNAGRLREVIEQRLEQYGVEVRLSHEVVRIGEKVNGYHQLHMKSGGVLAARMVVNAAFASINSLHEHSELPQIPMHYATFLHFLVELPEEHRHRAAMVVQGKYCLVVPSSFRGGHIFAAANIRVVGESTTAAPSEEMTDERAKQLFEEARRECWEYVPVLAEAEYRGYVLGTRVAALAVDDGSYSSKSLFYRDFDGRSGYHVLLGGKVTCVHETLDATLAAAAEL